MSVGCADEESGCCCAMLGGSGNWRNYRICDKMDPTVIEDLLGGSVVFDGDASNFILSVMRLRQLTDAR
jgi:hypothetical protein